MSSSRRATAHVGLVVLTIGGDGERSARHHWGGLIPGHRGRRDTRAAASRLVNLQGLLLPWSGGAVESSLRSSRRSMPPSLSLRIAARITEWTGQYHRLRLVVGTGRTGKIPAVSELSQTRGWSLPHLDLALAWRMLDLTRLLRRLRKGASPVRIVRMPVPPLPPTPSDVPRNDPT